MKNTFQGSRRHFLATSVRGAALLGAGAVFIGSAAIPLAGFAQGSSDLDYRNQIAAIGTTSLQSSKLALSKARHPLVKLFAKFEAAEQETIGGILKDMGTTVPSLHPADPDFVPTLQKLSGTAFDKAYMDGQVKAHIKLKGIVTGYMHFTNDIHVKHLTGLALVIIEEHIERGQMLINQLG